MKNIIKIASLLLIAATLFIGCGNKTKANDNGCYETITSAFEAAAKNKQDVLVVVTMKGDDSFSAEFVDNILNTSDFKNGLAKEYTVLAMDFSEESFKKTVVSDEDTKEQQKAAEAYSVVMQDNAKLASLLSVQTTPAFYLFTSDKYVIDEITYTEDVKSYADFKALVAVKAEKSAEIHAYVDAVKNTSQKEKVQAIDNLYEATSAAFKPFLSDLIEEVIKLDKDNSTGLLGKYVFANADTLAQTRYMDGDTEGSANAYIEACSNQYLDDEDKQQCYYMAAYILSMAGSNDYDKILGYLQSAINAAPESDGVEGIRQVYNYIASALEAYASSSEN